MVGSLLLLLSIEITYVANEGFLIASGEDKLLIDALQSGGIEEYLAPSRETLEELGTARGSFEGVDLMLASHRHVDHFDPSVAARHLENNPEAVMVSTSEMTAAVRSLLPSAAAALERIVEAPYPPDASRFRHREGGIEVQILRLDHEGFPRNDLQNLGHLISIGGLKLLHAGDAQRTEENFARHRFPEEGIDIALLPYWYLLDEDGRVFVREHIAPKWIIAIHVPPAEVKEKEAEIREHLPDVVFFRSAGEKKRF